MTPAEGPKRNPWSRVFHADEVFHFQGNTCEEIGLTMRLRWYAAAHNGIPATEESLIRIAKQSGLTRNRFIKLWRILSEKFTEIDGLLFYVDDYERRKEAEAESAKSSQAGKKGAEIRWGKPERRIQSVPEVEIATPFFLDSYHHHHHQPPVASVVVKPLAGKPPPPPTTEQQTTVVEGVVSPPASNIPPPEEFVLTGPLSTEDYQQFVIHCAEVRSPDGVQGVSIPSRKLCERLRMKFPPGTLVSDLVKSLPKFNGQHSPGRWDTMTAEELQLEAMNQAIRRDTPIRKPTAREEQIKRQMAWAEEQTRKQAAT